MHLPRFTSKFLISFSLILLISTFISGAIPSITIAQYSSNADSSSVNQNIERERLQYRFIEFTSLISCQLLGMDVIQQTKGCYAMDPTSMTFVEGKSIAQGNRQIGGVAGTSSSLITGLYQSSFQTSDFTRDMAYNFGISKKTYAQQGGQEGFTTLNPLLNIWKMVRDITYVIALIVFVIIGFGIMLRLKIDPRTVMTLQNQIPKIIIGLILITFSYAIAGLLVDAMWVSTYFGVNTLASSLPDSKGNGFNESQANNATSELLSPPLSYVRNTLTTEDSEGNSTTGGQVFEEGITGLSSSVGGVVGGTISEVIMNLFNMDTSGTCASITGGIDIGNCVKGGFKSLLQFILAPVAAVIVAIVIIVTLMRVWFTLIKAYVMILIDVCLAPIWIVMGLFPGSSMSFGKWLRHILSHLMVFPATVILLLFASIMANTPFGANNDGSGVFIPPLIGSPNSLTIGMGPLIAFGILLLTPQLLQIIRDAFGSKPSSNTGAIGKSLGIGAGVAAATFNPLQKALLGKDKDHAGPLRALFTNRARNFGNTATTGAMSKPGLRTIGNVVGNTVGLGQKIKDRAILEQERNRANSPYRGSFYELNKTTEAYNNKATRLGITNPDYLKEIEAAAKMSSYGAELHLKDKFDETTYKKWKNNTP